MKTVLIVVLSHLSVFICGYTTRDFFDIYRKYNGKIKEIECWKVVQVVDTSGDKWLPETARWTLRNGYDSGNFSISTEFKTKKEAQDFVKSHGWSFCFSGDSE